MSVTDAADKTTSYAYDPFGKLIKTTDPVGNVVTAAYDVRGRKIAASDPDLGAWTYACETAFTYDNLNRVTSATVSQNIAPVKSFAYDAIGNLLSKSDVCNYTYPLAGSAPAVTSLSGGNINTGAHSSADAGSTAKRSQS